LTKIYSTLLLDVDGVLMDFLGHSLKWHDRMDMYEFYPRGVWDIPTVLGLSATEFWKKIDNEQFWSTLPVYPGASAFLDQLFHTMSSIRTSVVFCTRSAFNVGAFAGARAIAMRKLCAEARIDGELPLYISAKGGKGVFAQPGHLLVDDYEENVREFRESDGDAILVPTPWNTLPGCEPDDCEVYMEGPDYRWLLNKIYSTMGV